MKNTITFTQGLIYLLFFLNKSYSISSSRQYLLAISLFYLPCLIISTLVLSAGNSYAQKTGPGRVHIIVKDADTKLNTAVRVRITHNGYVVNVVPRQAAAVMYGLWDHADGYGFQPDSSFYTEGNFEADLPAGNYHISLSKGNEYLAQQHELEVEAGKTLKKTFTLTRWINTPARGWYSADGHIHIRRSPREDPLLTTWIKAEDIHVGVLLRMGDFWEIYYPQYAWGEKGVYKQDDYLFVSGQEDPRTPELGHVLSLGASNRVRKKESYYYYDDVLDSLQALGGLRGYAHGAEAYHGYRGLVLDGLRNKVDYLEILQYCSPGSPLITAHYYHLLDMGIPVTALAGSDFPWCGKDHSKGRPEISSQIGNARFYTYTGNKFNYQTWKQAVAKGNTFVSTGPVIDFKVNNHLPGDKVEVNKNATLTISAHAYGHTQQVPLQTLEIIGHGKVLARVTSSDLKQSAEHLSIELKLPVTQGMWLAARCYAAGNGAAHTTPVYVSVDGKGFHNPATIDHYISLSEKYLQELETILENKTHEAEYQAWRYREGLLLRIQEARQVLTDIKNKAN